MIPPLLDPDLCLLHRFPIERFPFYFVPQGQLQPAIMIFACSHRAPHPMKSMSIEWNL